MNKFKISENLRDEIVDYLSEEFLTLDRDTLISFFIEGFKGFDDYDDQELIDEMENCSGIDFRLADADDSDVQRIGVALKLLNEIRTYEFEQEVLDAPKTS